jgi:hypothetical protein
MLRFVSLLALAFALSSCAAMEQQMRDTSCNREYGYEQGANDANAGNGMNSSFASVCDPQTKREVMKAYREGYEATANRSTLDVSNGGVRLKGPGININVGNRASKNWVCEIDVFGKSYSGFGATRNEAVQEVRNRCGSDVNSVHCHGESCERAQ